MKVPFIKLPNYWIRVDDLVAVLRTKKDSSFSFQQREGHFTLMDYEGDPEDFEWMNENFDTFFDHITLIEIPDAE